ncbi:tripartite tricarboxylate transporter TctB family protein [Pasteurellaceae bacterium HPA106]|uniref:tripartite tricarboxylate transporter TctB family protein n=1 Tax=Spirabiliibacterium pneumoniae TaxID=221400 RepID=UPI001AAC9294|nr:tripartite tricarboxylate transporter TctB family protein [Spirabiliibacterium pneumoniae]MBE2895919.1 tripartite tricarboxylate transporter TctB family protein [Spirabiliibacterium pneumoniae]
MENHKKIIDYIILSIYIFFLAVASFALYYANTFPDFTMANDIGAARFPLFYATALALLCLIGIGKTLFKPSLTEPISSLPLNIKRAIIAIIFNILTIYLIPIIGFYLASFLFSCVLMLLLGIKSKKNIILTALGITILIYIVFQLLLNVPLPLGIIFE